MEQRGSEFGESRRTMSFACCLCSVRAFSVCQSREREAKSEHDAVLTHISPSEGVRREGCIEREREREAEDGGRKGRRRPT